MKFYNKHSQIIEASNIAELIANVNFNDAYYESVCYLSCDFQITIALYYVYDENNEPVYISNTFQVLNPDAKSILDKYNKNGYKGDTVAFKSGDIAKIVKQILKKVGRDEKSSVFCSAKFYTEKINELKTRLRDKLNKEKFLIRAKKFKNELNALLDKYGFCFESDIDICTYNINDDCDVTASLSIKETEFTGSKRCKIEIMKIETMDSQDDTETEYPELKIDSVIQESY